MTADFSSETMQARRNQHNIFICGKKTVRCEFYTWINCQELMENKDIHKLKETKKIY